MQVINFDKHSFLLTPSREPFHKTWLLGQRKSQIFCEPLAVAIAKRDWHWPLRYHLINMRPKLTRGVLVEICWACEAKIEVWQIGVVDHAVSAALGSAGAGPNRPTFTSGPDGLRIVWGGKWKKMEKEGKILPEFAFLCLSLLASFSTPSWDWNLIASNFALSGSLGGWWHKLPQGSIPEMIYDSHLHYAYII